MCGAYGRGLAAQGRRRTGAYQAGGGRQGPELLDDQARGAQAALYQSKAVMNLMCGKYRLPSDSGSGVSVKGTLVTHEPACACYEAPQLANAPLAPLISFASNLSQATEAKEVRRFTVHAYVINLARSARSAGAYHCRVEEDRLGLRNHNSRRWA